MRGTLTTLTIMALALAALPARAADQDPSTMLYLQYCGACHGPGGKGDGIAGALMKEKPTDLTQLAKKNGGDFPYMRVMEIIDGRTSVRAHGDPDMPVWGEVFGDRSSWDMARRMDVRGKLMVLTDHLRAIQAK